MFTKESPPGEHQPLLRTLTRLDDDSERRGEGSIALKNREELEEVYPSFFFLFLFSTRVYLMFVLHTYVASACSSHVCIE